MASAVEADVTCPVCLEIFNQPVLLRCRHTLCSGCSALVEVQPMKIQCPTCREFTDRSEVAHDFKTQNWVELYKQLKSKELAEAPSAPPADAEMESSPAGVQKESSSDNNPDENSQEPIPISKEEAMAQASGSNPIPIDFKAPESSLYPRLSPPPPYSETMAAQAAAPEIPSPEVVLPEEEVDGASLRNFLNADMHQEEVFKFRQMALSANLVQGKIWVVLGDGTIKTFKKTGYQFGRYINSDLQVYQQSSALWSVLQWKEGSDKYVYKVQDVTEAHNGDIIAACAGCANSWSFDSVGLVQINNIGQVLATISSKHYRNVTHDGKLVYATPADTHKGNRIEMFHYESPKWVIHRKVNIDSDVIKTGVGHGILYGSDDAVTLFKYDLMGKPEVKGKRHKYQRDVIRNPEGVKPAICHVDPHGNCLVWDTKTLRLFLVSRDERWVPLCTLGSALMKPRGAEVEDSSSLVVLTENVGGVARLVRLYKQ